MARKANPEIERFILESVEDHPRDIVALVAGRFEISRQAAHRHVAKLVAQKLLAAENETSKREYHLLPIVQQSRPYKLSPTPQEDTIWREFVSPLLGDLPQNLVNICHHGVTEMVNNAIDHSAGTQVEVTVVRSGASLQIEVRDDGIGIFKKIRESLGLSDDRQSLLELAKGKFTTDPKKHSGEGIFFTSRMFDSFSITSDRSTFVHHSKNDDWMFDSASPIRGTYIVMKISPFATRTAKEVFDEYSNLETYSFSKTHVPLKLATIGEDGLVSRSQAKRVLARFDKFEEIWLDFSEVDSIGQAFADEIFRVFASEHPSIKLVTTHTTPQIDKMISRARNTNI